MRLNNAGQFTLHNVPPGTHKLYAESTRIGAFTNRPEVTVVKGEVRTGVEIADTQKVLDGHLDPYIEASLKQGL